MTPRYSSSLACDLFIIFFFMGKYDSYSFFFLAGCVCIGEILLSIVAFSMLRYVITSICGFFGLHWEWCDAVYHRVRLSLKLDGMKWIQIVVVLLGWKLSPVVFYRKLTLWNTTWLIFQLDISCSHFPLFQWTNESIFFNQFDIIRPLIDDKP